MAGRKVYPKIDSTIPARATKQTTPQGIEIPVPKRKDFLRDLKKVAAPTKE